MRCCGRGGGLNGGAGVSKGVGEGRGIEGWCDCMLLECRGMRRLQSVGKEYKSKDVKRLLFVGK